MAESFTLIREDRFGSTLASIQTELTDLSKADTTHMAQDAVRRPLTGLEHKKDKYATLRVIHSTGKRAEVYNTSAPYTFMSTEPRATYTSNLLLQSIQEVREEKSQIIQTFGDDFVYFFGERPVQLQLTAQLLDTQNFRWHQEWWQNYADFFRGTSLVRNDARAYIEIEEVMYEGYVLNASTSRESMNPRSAQLSFRFLVTNKIYLRPIKNNYDDMQLLDVETAARASITSSFSPQLALAENEFGSVVGIKLGTSDPVSTVDPTLAPTLGFWGTEDLWAKVFQTQANIRRTAQTMYVGVPTLSPNQALSLESALQYFDPTTGSRIVGDPKTYIKNVTELYRKIYDHLVYSTKVPFYTSSPEQYPNRSGNNPEPKDTRTIVTSEKFLQEQKNKLQIYNRRSALTRTVASIKAKEGSISPLSKSDMWDESGLGSIARGVHAQTNENPIFTDTGDKSFLDTLGEVLGSVQNAISFVATYGVIAANILIAGIAIRDMVNDFSLEGFLTSIKTGVIDAVTFDDAVSTADPDLSSFDTPSGSAQNFDETENTTPYNQDRANPILLTEVEQDESLIIAPTDFSIFTDIGNPSSNDIVILE